MKDLTPQDSIVVKPDTEENEKDTGHDEREDTDENIELTEEASVPKIVYGEKNDSSLYITDELRSQIDELIEKVDGLWECKKCSKTFLVKGDARKHAEFHLTQISYACAVCSKTLRTRSGLK